jgi:hypothetical protein
MPAARIVFDFWYTAVQSIALRNQTPTISNVGAVVQKPYFYVTTPLPSNQGVATHRFFLDAAVPLVKRGWGSLSGSVLIDVATKSQPVPRIYIVSTSQEVYDSAGTPSGIYVYCRDNDAVSSSGRYAW